MGRPKKLVENQLYILSLRITRPQYVQLRALSRMDSLSQQEHLRRALELYLDEREIDPEIVKDIVREDQRKLGLTPTPITRSKALPKRAVPA